MSLTGIFKNRIASMAGFSEEKAKETCLKALETLGAHHHDECIKSKFIKDSRHHQRQYDACEYLINSFDENWEILKPVFLSALESK